LPEHRAHPRLRGLRVVLGFGPKLRIRISAARNGQAAAARRAQEANDDTIHGLGHPQKNRPAMDRGDGGRGSERDGWAQSGRCVRRSLWRCRSVGRVSAAGLSCPVSGRMRSHRRQVRNHAWPRATPRVGAGGRVDWTGWSVISARMKIFRSRAAGRD